ncbi:TPA: plasmid replication initiation protein [Raoultella ornithinolytica]|nr:plasmid replication initiation protein [Raoultella ornithinolytica]
MEDEVTRLRQQLSQMADLLDAEKAARRLPKNMDFVQVSRADLRAIAELGAKSSLALDLLMILAQTMDKQNAVMISFKAMQDILGKSRPTLDRAVRLLKEDNWIQVIKVGTANAYILNNAVFWTDRGDKRPLTQFNARVVTTLAEQEMDLRNNPNVKLRRTPTLVGKDERVVVGTDQLPPPDQQDLELD